MPELIFTPTDFVALTNQVLGQAFPSATIEGELSDLRISKNKWVYFNLKDDYATVKFFGTIYMLPGPLEDGMTLRVTGNPQLHPAFGFSVTVRTIVPSGEGSIKKAFDLLRAKLTAEGLFEPTRKRLLPYPPSRIGLITSGGSAAYADFVKILSERWGGVAVELADVQVQGEAATTQIVGAIEWFNRQAELVEVLVLTRGGGSLDDLAVFNTEQVTRAIAASRIPTLVAIGHEVDTSLAELAADQRASTPSNAAQLLVPERQQELSRLHDVQTSLADAVRAIVTLQRQMLQQSAQELISATLRLIDGARVDLVASGAILEALNPLTVLRRGYAVVRDRGHAAITSIRQIQPGDGLEVSFYDGTASVITSVVTPSGPK